MLPRSASPNEQSGTHDGAELKSIRRTLERLEKGIENKRIALAKHTEQAARLDQEWEEDASRPTGCFERS